MTTNVVDTLIEKLFTRLYRRDEMKLLSVLLLTTNVAFSATIVELPPLPTTPPPMPIVILPPITPGQPIVFQPFDTGKLVR